MSGLLNCVRAGNQAPEAYRTIIGKDAKDACNADVHADQLTSRPGVRERIEELKAASAQRCSMTREQFLESLVAMYQGQPGKAALDNPLCDSLISRGVWHAVFPMKATIANQIARLCGWDASVKVEVDVSDKLAGLLDRVFGAGAEKES